ncbi:MAG TPA: M1 family aminopeptidase [Blastocatellia bacterium]|nr:M1 family aminopeptidase [Blastocatellia bacterium]
MAQNKADNGLDVLHYKIEAEIDPANYRLTARTLVRLRLQAPSRSVVLELNGSLVVSRVTDAQSNQPLEFLQDRLDQVTVRVDLGKVIEAGSEVALVFDYAGELRTAEGGPIPDRRLAYVGPEGSYLFYASRWFPFHDYAADRATYEITLVTPPDLRLVGYSEQAVTAKPVSAVVEAPRPTEERPSPPPRQVRRRPTTTPPPPSREPQPARPQPRQDRVSYTLVCTQPVLPGSLALGKYIVKEVTNPSGVRLELFAKPGDENRLEALAEPLGQMLKVYIARFGPYAFGDRLRIAEVDNETLDYYSGPGVLFLAPHLVAGDRPLDLGRLAREVAYQWWGQAVALRSFDDAWLSQGLAQYSSLLFREATAPQAEYEQALQETMERALAFESAASIARAPIQLYDLSPSYQAIVFYKGAFVFHMLRYVLGDEKFFSLITSYYNTYNGKNASIADFETLTSRVAGREMRAFFGLWVDSTGVPEFRLEYTILRTREGKFKVRGTVKQNLEIFDMPVEILLKAEGGKEEKTVIVLKGTEGPFEIASETPPVEVIIDPNYRILHLTDQLRVAVIVRRGIEHLNNREYPEAEQQFRAALELDSLSSWAHYNLGLLYFEQRNFPRAVDAFSDAINGNQRPPWVVVWSYIYRGNCWDALGQRERAVADYQKAIETRDDYNGALQVAQKYLEQPYTPTRARAAGHAAPSLRNILGAHASGLADRLAETAGGFFTVAIRARQPAERFRNAFVEPFFPTGTLSFRSV